MTYITGKTKASMTKTLFIGNVLPTHNEANEHQKHVRVFTSRRRIKNMDLVGLPVRLEHAVLLLVQ